VKRSCEKISAITFAVLYAKTQGLERWAIFSPPHSPMCTLFSPLELEIRAQPERLSKK
jgi:hypothetical protein